MSRAGSRRTGPRRTGCAGLVAILLVLAAGFWVLQSWSGRGPLPRATTVTIASGTSLAGAAEQLEKAGAISSATRFRLFARLFGSAGAIKAGEYRLAARISQVDILKVLQGTKTIQRFVTIPEGWPAVFVKDALLRERELTGDVPVPPEGSVLPDSYSFQRGDTRLAIVQRMQRAMDEELADAWAKRGTGLAVKTSRETLILASIVEKETGKPSERAMVAAVYANRLKRGMPLQADPTIIYPITRGRPLGRRILESEVHEKNAYNTYAMSGLPAGPICNPGRASIEAVLHPATSNALYFVADGSGGHAFADTLEQHNANVVKWRAYRAAHGI